MVQRLVDCEREAGWPSFVPSSPTASKKKAAVKKQRAVKKAPARTTDSNSPRQQAAEAGSTDSASEGDPPESLAAVVKMAELTIEQLKIVVEKSDESAFTDTDADGRTPLHHLCERRWGVDLISTLVTSAPQAVTMTDAKGKTPLACLLTGPAAGKHFGDEGCKTDKEWGQHLRTVLTQKGAPLRAARNHEATRSVAEGDLGKWTGEGRSEQCQVNWNEKGSSWVPWSVVEPAVDRVDRPVTVEMVACLCSIDSGLVSTQDKSGNLPVQHAIASKLSADVVDYLRSATTESPAVWFSSAVEDTDSGQSTFHVLIHATGSPGPAAPGSEELPKHYQLPGALEALAEDSSFAASTTIRGLPFAVDEIDSVCCGPKHLALLLKTGSVYRSTIKIRQSTLEKVSGTSGAHAGSGKSPAQLRLEEAEKRVTQQASRITEMRDKLRQLEKQRYDVNDEDPLIEMLAGASGKSPDDVKAALGRFPPGPQRGELAFNVLFGTQVFGTGDEADMPPDADQAGVQRFQIKKEEKRLAELEAIVKPLKDAVEEVQGARADSADIMLSLGPLQQWPVPPCEFVQISATLSELVARGTDGSVHRWKWGAKAGEPHPCSPKEPVRFLASSSTRTTLLTESGKLCSWLDASLWTCRDEEKQETPPDRASEDGEATAEAEGNDDDAHSDEDLPPAVLHPLCGSNIQIFDDNTRARKTNSFNNATVFTAMPLAPSKTGERRFEVLIEKHGNSYSGSIRIGFTATDPSSLSRIDTESYSIARSWILDGTSVHSSSRGDRESSKYPSLGNMRTDSRIAAIVDADGGLRFEYDGVDQGLACGGLPPGEELWGVVDLYGQCDQICLVGGSAGSFSTPDSILEKLEHPPMKLKMDSKVQFVSVSNKGSCAATASGSVYWWGYKPWGLRLQSFRDRQAADTAADFDKAYEAYIKTVDDKQMLCSKPEMTALLASESSFRQRLRRAGSITEKKKEKRQLKAGKSVTAKIGPDSPQGKALQNLKDVYQACIDKIKVGDTVVVNQGTNLYATQSVVIVENKSGFPEAYRLQKPVNVLETELELVGYKDRKVTTKVPMQSATFVSREVCPDQAEVVQLNKAKGVAVLRSMKDDELLITDLVTLVGKQTLHDDFETLQQTPLCVFDEAKLEAAVGDAVSLRWGADSRSDMMIDYYRTELEPSLCDHYSNDNRRVFTAKSVSVTNWIISVVVADQENCLFQYSVDLETGTWEFMPLRYAQPAGDPLKAQRWGADASSKPLLEVDEERNLCNSASVSLPSVCFGAVASYDCDGSSVSVAMTPPASSEAVGTVVTVSATYREHDDAEQGPLKPGQTGTIDKSDGNRLRVKSDNGKTWWYYPAALQLTKSLPPVVSIVALGLAPRAAPLADGSAGLARSTSRKVLHSAATGSASLLEMLDVPPNASLRRVLTARDATGATAFMCAMRRADLVQAAAIASAAAEIENASPETEEGTEKMLCAVDINRDTPLHALLGLAATKVERVQFQPDHLRLLRQILDNSAVGVTTQRNVAGETALQTYIVRNGLDSTTRWTVVHQSGVNIRQDASFDRDPIGRLSPGDELVAVGVKTVRGLQWIQLQNPVKHGVSASHKKAWVLIKKGPTLLEQKQSPSEMAPKELVNAVCQCTRAVHASLEVPPVAAVSHDSALEWRDCFAYALVSCGQNLATSFARTVSKMSASAAMEEAKLAKLFSDSVARGFVALLSQTGVSSNTAKLRKVFLAVFHELGGIAIQSLASIAAFSVQSVRLGMPIPEVKPAEYTLQPSQQDLKTKGEIKELLPPPRPELKETKSNSSPSLVSGHGDPTHGIGDHPTAVGQRVTVVDDFDDSEEYDDAQDGPLEPGEEGIVEKITGSRYLVRPVEPEDDAPSTWWYDQAALVVTGAASRSRDGKAKKEEDAKEAAVVARARMFHLCLVTITALGKEPSLERTTTRRFSANPAESVQEGETDTALLFATSLLQPAWTFVYESCDALEEMLRTEARTEDSPALKLCEQLRGQRNELDSNKFRHIALMLDALVRFKQALPVLEASDTEVDAPELRGLVRSISHLQVDAPAALRDAWSTLRRDELLDSLQKLSDEERISHAEGCDLRRSPLLWFLFRHRRTIEMLASISVSGDPVDGESFLKVLEPYEKKQTRFHQRMSERRTSIPEDRPTLKIAVPRGEGLLAELFKQLESERRSTGGGTSRSADGGVEDESAAAADGNDVGEQALPLCRKLDCSYVGEPGEGSGMTRMVVTDVTKALRAAEGAGAGLFQRSPLVATTHAKWWEREPMGRVVPAQEPSVASGASAVNAGAVRDESGQEAVQRARQEREDRLQGVGNVIGLCLLHGVKFPLFFCRHVYKAMLGRKVNYADYAYYDPSNHSMLLSLVRDASSMDDEEDMMLAWDETVGFTTPLEEGNEAPPVTPRNVHAYVLRKAHFDMVDCVSSELAALVRGLHDVIVRTLQSATMMVPLHSFRLYD